MAQGQGGEATTAPNAIAAAAPASGVWDEGGDLRYIAKALIGASPYFSRSSELLLGVVVCWVLGVVVLLGVVKKCTTRTVRRACPTAPLGAHQVVASAQRARRGRTLHKASSPGKKLCRRGGDVTCK